MSEYTQMELSSEFEETADAGYNENKVSIDLRIFVPDVHFELIPIKNLLSNQEYQRNLSIQHAKRVAENFDIYQINPVKVSRRDGVNYIFNGQHTVEIVALISGSRETPVWCMIYDDLEYEHEADIFANQMKYVKALLPYEIFMANIEAGNDEELNIKALVEDLGMTITPSAAPNGICAVTTLEKIYDRYGFNALHRVLRLVIGTWEGAPNSTSANMLNGVAKLIDAYGDSLKDDVFKEKLSRVSVKEISRDAKERRAGALGYAEVLLMQYNMRRTNKLLQWERLYKTINNKQKTQN
ncbi:hypothetical protein J2S20_000339 [Moryella indoligenes]|uniref:Uncharacterized protein n=1 Tax=Moryella indoligenes TaxID=371674 RepID=A0AAE4AJX7_9FIRM|nr:hypothetical protein [Moryella indoligenes]